MKPLSMTEVTLAIQGRVGRESTIRLLRRAGEASRASKNEFAPISILMLFQKRMEDGEPVAKLVLIPNGKLIKLTRSHLQSLNKA